MSRRAVLAAASLLALVACDGPPPAEFGPRPDDTLLPCPMQIDCVNTGLREPRGTRGVFARGAVPVGDIMERVGGVVEGMPGARVDSVTDFYLHAEFRHGLFYVDDLEVLLIPTRELIVRSSPRRRSEGTLNVERVEELRRRLHAAEIIR